MPLESIFELLCVLAAVMLMIAIASRLILVWELKEIPGAVDLTWEACDSGAGSLDAEVSILWLAAGVLGGFWCPKDASCDILVVILYLSRRVDSVGLDLGHSVRACL
jgi:hypothetical protein